MKSAILTFDGFNEIDSIVAAVDTENVIPWKSLDHLQSRPGIGRMICHVEMKDLSSVDKQLRE